MDEDLAAKLRVNISFSPRAARDLEEIGDYIARDNPLRAVSFLNELLETCGKLPPRRSASRPGRTSVPTFAGTVPGRYLILYTVQPSAVRVERILHGARNWVARCFSLLQWGSTAPRPVAQREQPHPKEQT